MLSHDLSAILAASSARHNHLCPRQVLGARIGLAGASALGLDIPRTDKRLLIFVESDGCFADGVEVATGCTMGHRTLRLEDYGKIAAVFVDVTSGRAVRVAPRLDVRERACTYAPDERRHYFAQLHAYQIMPDDELLSIQPVSLTTPVAQIVSKPIVRTNCQGCGEEIINEREVVAHGQTLCRSCAGLGYYHPEAENHPLFARHTESRDLMSRQIHPALLDDLGLVPALTRYVDEFGDQFPEISVDLHSSLAERLPRLSKSHSTG